jgi:hypothetical protein
MLFGEQRCGLAVWMARIKTDSGWRVIPAHHGSTAEQVILAAQLAD